MCLYVIFFFILSKIVDIFKFNVLRDPLLYNFLKKFIKFHDLSLQGLLVLEIYCDIYTLILRTFTLSDFLGVYNYLMEFFYPNA